MLRIALLVIAGFVLISVVSWFVKNVFIFLIGCLVLFVAARYLPKVWK